MSSYVTSIAWLASLFISSKGQYNYIHMSKKVSESRQSLTSATCCYIATKNICKLTTFMAPPDIEKETYTHVLTHFVSTHYLLAPPIIEKERNLYKCSLNLSNLRCKETHSIWLLLDICADVALSISMCIWYTYVY